MNLKIFTTSRQVRKWLEDKNNQFLDKYYTLGEFLGKIIIVDDKKFVDNDFRKKYLFEAIKNVDVEKLGISREFINFFEDSDFIFSFFNELFLEKVDINKVIMNDVYLDFEEHLLILKEILKNYEKLLEKDGYIDKFLIKDYRINSGLLDGIDKIELILDGYLTKFDIEVLKKLPVKIEISFDVDRFNKNLIEKSLNISVKEKRHYIYDFVKLKESEKKKNNPIIKVEYFSDRMNEISFVFAKIKEFIESGIAPENIAVILPDESFSEFLELFDEKKNLNFAMGESFTKSNIYIKLKSIYDYLSGDTEAIKKCEDLIEEFEKMDLIEFIKKHSTNNELKVIDEELFKLNAFKDMFKDKKEFLYFILGRLKDKKFDDVYSGRVTCMGVLESRGMEFEGVILVDFNDEVVPNVGESDMFLNTFIRKHSNLPTRFDKENLQKHYYFQLINNAKKVAISYVKNEENAPSKFLYELELDLGENADEKYEFFKISNKKEITKYNETLNIKFPIYPTTLKTLLECPKRYYFEKVLKITEQNDDEFFGNIFHNSLDEIDKNGFNFSSWSDYYNTLIDKIISKIKDKKLLFEVMVKWDERIKNFCEKDFELRSGKTSNPEKTKTFIYKGYELAARIDRIDEDDKEIVLIDYKTSKSAEKSENYIYEFQTTFYYLWAKNKYKNKNIKTYIWDIGESKLIEGVIKIELLDEVLDNMPKEVKEAEDIIIDEKVIKKASDICRYCPYVVACGKEN